MLSNRSHASDRKHLGTLQRDNSTMAPKNSKKAALPAAKPTLVLDHGAYSIKAGLLLPGLAEPSYDDCAVIPNCIARSTRDKCSYIGSELDNCKDFGELAFRRPVEKGYIVNWEAEKAIWEHEFMGSVAREGLRVGTIYVQAMMARG
jgi:actin-related protein 6